MKICAVASCRKDSANFPGVTFFNLPRDPCAKFEWLDALGLKYSEPSSNIKVCETHFRPKDFCAKKKQLKAHAVPVLNLGVRKTEPLDSEDEFMRCDSDDDVLREVKKLTAVEALMDRKIKQEPEEKPPEQEQETGRRPSRRAAREAAKKIYNTVRNYGCTPDTDDSEVINTRSQRESNTPRRESNTARPTQRQRQRSYHNIKVPPPNIDLVMECHEELLSNVQAEALLQAQLQYNMVMKTLRSLKATNNVRIICQSADDPPPIKDSDEEDDSKPIIKSENNSSDSKEPKISEEASKKESNTVIPMKLSANVSSPAPSILS